MTVLASSTLAFIVINSNFLIFICSLPPRFWWHRNYDYASSKPRPADLRAGFLPDSRARHLSIWDTTIADHPQCQGQSTTAAGSVLHPLTTEQPLLPPATLIPSLPVSADLQLTGCWWHCWKWQGCHLAPPGLQCLAPQSLCKQYKDARARQPQSGEDDRGAKQGSVLLNLVSFPGYLILKRLIWWKCKFFKTYIVFFGGGGLQNILELDLSPKCNYRMVWSSGGHLRLQIQVFFPKQNSFCL